VRLFKFIDAEKAYYPISLLCRILKVSRSGYYGWKDRSPSKRDRENAALTEKIREIHNRSRSGSMATHASMPSSELWECAAPGSGLHD
jgi:putative transposase